ncbi:MAG: hypothetical protein SCK28_06975 [Bacillota bacterium]|nr:hypothetical protein [Bacillota bacterium]
MAKLNKPLIAILIGMILILPLEIYTQIFKYFGLTKVSAFEYTSMIVSREPNWWVGILTGPGVAGTATLLLYYSSIIWGTDYFPLKGAFVGAITYSFIAILKSLLTEFTMLTTGHFIHALGGTLGGFFSGYLLKRYLSDPIPIESHSAKRKLRYQIAPVPALKPNYVEGKTKKYKTPKK